MGADCNGVGARRGSSVVIPAGGPAAQIVSRSDKVVSVRMPAGEQGDVLVAVRTSVGTSAARHFDRR